MFWSLVPSSSFADSALKAVYASFDGLVEHCIKGQTAGPCNAAADTLKNEVCKVLVDPKVDNETKQYGFMEAARAYRFACAVDYPTNHRKLMAVVADSKRLFPGGDAAASSEAALIETEISTTNIPTFLRKIGAYAKAYPGFQGDDGGPWLVDQYVEKLKTKDVFAAIRLLKESLLIYPQTASLVNLKKSLDLTGKKAQLIRTTLDGKKFDLADWHGKVVVIEYWDATCHVEISKQLTPKLVKFYDDMKGKDFAMVGVSFEYDEKDATDYVASSKMEWP